MNQKFPREEKLKSRKLIERLFSDGKSQKSFPVKLLFLENDKSLYNQVAFSVPKRSFKLAVARNKIKRQMREAYRLHKHLLTNDSGRKFALLFLYISKEKTQYAQISSSIEYCLKTLQNESN